jgi:diguanylate cyclase (GGDEF)-like protein
MTMRLLPTLFVVHAVVFALLGGFFYAVWRTDREEEYRWWLSAIAGVCAGLLFFALRDLHPTASIAGGNLLTLWGVGLVWAGVRVFVGRPVRLEVALAGGVVWIAAFTAAEPSVRVVGRAVLATFYSYLIAYELWTYRREQAVAPLATAALATAHGVFNAAAAVFVVFLALRGVAAHEAYPVVDYLALEGVSYSLVLGFALFAMSNERSVARQRLAATTDPLTGLSNRRSFDHSADLAIRAAQASALLVFDLDCLKAINDRFGHSMGDRALKTFGDVAAKNIRSGDVLARVGGDEFALLLTHVDRATAVSVAERIRSAFAAAASTLGGSLGSVSVGIALAEGEAGDLHMLKEAADRALYAGKAAGRNQVFVSSERLDSAARLEIPRGAAERKHRLGDPARSFLERS